MIEAVAREGAGSTGSRLLRGNREGFAAIERRFASLKRTERSLYFSSGYLANLAVLTTFPEPGDVILSDERKLTPKRPRLNGIAYRRPAAISLALTMSRRPAPRFAIRQNRTSASSVASSRCIQQHGWHRHRGAAEDFANGVLCFSLGAAPLHHYDRLSRSRDLTVLKGAGWESKRNEQIEDDALPRPRQYGQ